MIEYIKGLITLKSPTVIVIETTSGVAYRINISLHTYAQIERLEQVKLLTYTQIKEDAHTLYGFNEEAERSLFVLLLSVSGIGATTAQVLLSSLHPDEVRAAILGENEAVFNKVKGIGPKTAKRIILDLKDKVKKDSGEGMPSALLNLSPQNNTIREEALAALVALGFVRINVQKTLNKILQEQPQTNTVEALIKIALRQLSA
jgi:holliday junction DNA helicase RuvA